MQITTEPYEFLARFRDGKLSGAHVQFIEVGRDGERKLFENILNAQPVGAKGFPLADILDQTTAAAVRATEAAREEAAALEAELKTTKQEAAAGAEAANEAVQKAKAAAADLETQLAEARAFSDGLLVTLGGILADEKVSEDELKTLLTEFHRLNSLPAREREAEALEAQIARLQAQAQELRAPSAPPVAPPTE